MFNNAEKVSRLSNKLMVSNPKAENVVNAPKTPTIANRRI